MAKSSLLGGERAPVFPSGKSTDLLGPSDSSDSGSDALGEMGVDELNSDSDRNGTGERGTVGLDGGTAGADILPDHVEDLAAEDDTDEGDDLSADS